MKEEAVRDILVKNHIPYAMHGTLYGTIIASVGAYQNGLGTIMHTMKDHILHFNSQGMAIIAIDDHNGTLREETLTYIRKEHVQSSGISIHPLTFLLTIQTDKGELKYKIRKQILGSPWHKENLAWLLLHQVDQKHEV